MTAPAYHASPIKRIRATKAEVEERREALLDIIDDGKPMTVRQVFYQATVRGLVEKAESGYAQGADRSDGHAPGGRSALRLARRQHPLAAQAADVRQRRGCAAGHRRVLSQEPLGRRRLLRRDLAGEGRALGRRLSGHHHVRRAAHGGARLCQPLVPVQRGRVHQQLDVPAYIYHLGDFDPSGVNAGEKIEETLRELAPDAEIYLRAHRGHARADRRIGICRPARPKPSDTRAKGFGAISVELDAIEPNQLRQLVQDAIEQHLPRDQFEVLKAAEESEREIISRLVHTATKRRAKGGAR